MKKHPKLQLHAILIIYTMIFLISMGLTLLLPHPSGTIEPEKPFGIHDFTPDKYPWVNETDV